jgi:probable transcriptional regulator
VKVLGYANYPRKNISNYSGKNRNYSEGVAQSIGITLNAIKYHIKNMTKSGVFKHKGSTKSGKWIIFK